MYAAWVERTQSDEVKAILDDEDGDAFEETAELVCDEWNDFENDEIDRAIEAMSPPFPWCVCNICFRRSVCLVLNAAAVCPAFGRRSACAHYLQPPAPLGFILSQCASEIAIYQLHAYKVFIWISTISRLENKECSEKPDD